MRVSRTALIVLLGLGAVAAPGWAQSAAKAKATTPDIPFESVPNFLKMPAGLYMGEAVDARDVDGLLAAGEVLDAACEACHKTYWYQRR